MRFATYNIEWFTGLFDDDNRLLTDDTWSSRYKVTRRAQADALGLVFDRIDADAVLIVEAPDTSRRRRTGAALEAFAAHYGLRTREAVMGFSNDTQQEIALLYDPDRISARHAPMSDGDHAPRFDRTFRIDLDIDATEDSVTFSKPPLELSVVTHGGFAFRMIGAHLKSKAPHGANGAQQIMAAAIANRRKQLAQAIWLRRRIEQHLAQGTPLIVLGDLNDGPGLDAYEALFGRSSVEIVMGTELYDPHARLALAGPLKAVPTSARFWIRPENRFLQAMLDYIMVTPDLRARDARWRIWHPLDDPECWGDAVLRDALVTASDHFPVTLDLAL
ncbi:endonuclease/exonuclease/phosphatase family protein [Sulfitobacter sabulilitoris]|uniref:Endonuclease n=1 Tax=Sulfitobacter sabulilitoris TaxID=2562655 RepID=A0A5S3PDH0_9RHOB|nr:endonuclease/exonuclease/phosphatase family protein [Sulfitobacter sabulilitoris]TMM50907.1 endonuclease [Sulfitobacter sabulilitoris]